MAKHYCKALIVPVFLTLLANGQTVDTAIIGTIDDSALAAIPNATITISQPSTGLIRTLTSSASSTYEIRYLVPGEYTIEARADGFRTERRTGIKIQLGQTAKLDFVLQVGSVQQTLEVKSGSAPPAD